MKSIIYKFFIVFTILFLSFSCSQTHTNHTREWMKKNGKIKVLSTTEMINDLVIAIGDEYVDCLTLIFGGLDPHSYEMVKGDDEKFSNADIVFYNGLGLEHGAFLVSNLQNHAHSVAIGEKILQKFPERALYIEGALDPHIWMDISLWKQGVDPIVSKLSELDPAHASIFEKNGKKIKEKLEKAHLEIFQILQSIPSTKRYLVTSHDAFNYFARSYLTEKQDWEKRFNAPEGLAPDGQLSSVNIMNILEHLKKYEIQVLFPESNVSRDSINKILRTGKKMNLALRISEENLYGDAMEVDERCLGENYINMMKHNARVIFEQLR